METDGAADVTGATGALPEGLGRETSPRDGVAGAAKLDGLPDGAVETEGRLAAEGLVEFRPVMGAGAGRDVPDTEGLLPAGLEEPLAEGTGSGREGEPEGVKEDVPGRRTVGRAVSWRFNTEGEGFAAWVGIEGR